MSRPGMGEPADGDGVLPGSHLQREMAGATCDDPVRAVVQRLERRDVAVAAHPNKGGADEGIWEEGRQDPVSSSVKTRQRYNVRIKHISHF